ncbi:MAG: tight adherence protein [Actinomycetota bacterium]|jgi:tight adherence protein C|nr:tight adherence protein [Actinomycetota bacterium]
MLTLIIAVSAGAVLLGAIATGAMLAERAQVRESLRRLESYQVSGARDQEMLKTFGSRVLSPFGSGLMNLVRKYTPVGYVDKLRHRLVLAGSPPGYEVDRMLIFKVIGAASIIVWIPLIYMALALSGTTALFAVGLLWVGSFLMADLSLGHKIEARQKEIARRLPDILDLLVISVEAGLGFEQAIDRTSNAVPGPLSEEFRRMLQETRVGASRADALRAIDQRTEVPELRSFILAMLQADTFGVSISRILRAQADEMRVRRRLAAQELAAKAPVKMLFPLVLCIFPAMFVVVLGPAFISISKNLS